MSASRCFPSRPVSYYDGPIHRRRADIYTGIPVCINCRRGTGRDEYLYTRRKTPSPYCNSSDLHRPTLVDPPSCPPPVLPFPPRFPIMMGRSIESIEGVQAYILVYLSAPLLGARYCRHEYLYTCNTCLGCPPRSVVDLYTCPHTSPLTCVPAYVYTRRHEDDCRYF